MARFALFFLLLVSAAFPWGLRGHRIVARIAERHLDENAQKKVKELLGDDTLTKVANEADGYRSDSKWKCAAPLHYVSVDDNETYADAGKNVHGDIVRALVYFEDRLRDKHAAAAEKQLALKWLVHLVGDIHQPLHVGRSCDRGGNSTEVLWFKSKSNLHKVWDSQLINHEELSFSEFAEMLDKIDSALAADWQRTGILAWILEAKEARGQIYTCLRRDRCCAGTDSGNICKAAQTMFGSCSEDKPDVKASLEYAYVERNRQLLNRQLAKAGIRLAGMLNRIFSGETLRKEDVELRGLIKAIEKDEGKVVHACVQKAGG